MKINSILVFVHNNKFYKMNRTDFIKTVELNYKKIRQNAKRVPKEQRKSYGKYVYRIKKDEKKDFQSGAISEFIDYNWEFFERLSSHFEICKNDFKGVINLDEYFRTDSISIFSKDSLSRITGYYSDKFSQEYKDYREDISNE